MGKVLVIGGSASGGAAVAELVERGSYTVLRAWELESALAIVESDRPDAAIIDCTKSYRDGLALLKELSRRTPFLPIIVIIKRPKISQLREVMQARAADFIAPPVTADDLIRSVGRAINKQCCCHDPKRFDRDEKVAALGRMAAQVAHEVRNPLAGLQLYSLHLKSKLAGKVAASEIALADKIIDGIGQLTETTERVLSFARTVTLSRRRVNLNRVVADSLALLEPQLREKSIRVNLTLTEAGAYAMLDEASVRSALINLMLNAIQAMAVGGQMIVTTAAGEGALRLAITDTGCGMTEEQMKNLFEPFYTTKSQGLGLGMSFASRIIQLHGGQIAVQSRAGAGTSVKIALPAEGEKANAAAC
ncbi:MAG TPA: ATP-binding protein [Blastocatellia bacterium]|nr:ATP-binding protein [Blastocatellia bacterium]